MFVLSRTYARWAFKDLLGQANHFLITILVGLNGIRKNSVTIDDEFRTSWNPKNSRRSAERSRVFALDLSLVRAVDALDTYFMMSVRKPCALQDADFISAMDGTGRSVAKRLRVFDAHLPSLRESHKAVLEVAIEWRNHRVHSLSDDRVNNATRKIIQDDSEFIKNHYSGLDVRIMLSHFDAGMSPTFKEAASIIHLCHQAVEHYDTEILSRLPIERYIIDNVVMILEQGGVDLSRPISRIWGGPKREAKALRLLRLAGVSKSNTAAGRQVPDGFVENFISLKPDDVENFLNAN